MKHQVTLFGAVIALGLFVGMTAPPQITELSWAPPANNLDLLPWGDGVEQLQGEKVDFQVRRVTVEITCSGSFFVRGADCWECPNSPNDNFCQDPPEDYGTKWKLEDVRIGAFAAWPGDELNHSGPNPYPTGSVTTQELFTSLVCSVPLPFAEEGLWQPVQANQPDTWTWSGGGEGERTFTLQTSDPDITRRFELRPGVDPPDTLWSMKLGAGRDYHLSWLGSCIHRYTLDAAWDELSWRVTLE